MATRNLPAFRDGEGHIKYSVTLDGQDYYFYLDWNERESAWYLSINDSNDTPIYGCQSRKIVVNWDILIGAPTDYDRPPGLVLTASTDHVDPGLLELGVRVGFYYVEQADV